MFSRYKYRKLKKKKEEEKEIKISNLVSSANKNGKIDEEKVKKFVMLKSEVDKMKGEIDISFVEDLNKIIGTYTTYRELKEKLKEKQEEYEEELLNSPLFQIAGMFAIGEPGWADKHDEYLGEVHIEDHADEK